MKLLFCPDCGDVVKLLSTFRSCRCRAVEGRYIDDEVVEMTGERAHVIGLDGHHLQAAVTLAHTAHPVTINAYLCHPTHPNVRRLGRKR